MTNAPATTTLDFNEDGVIDIEDINEALDMLTDGAMEESLKDEIAARVSK
jgi:hypothetical protein